MASTWLNSISIAGGPGYILDLVTNHGKRALPSKLSTRSFLVAHTFFVADGRFTIPAHPHVNVLGVAIERGKGGSISLMCAGVERYVARLNIFRGAFESEAIIASSFTDAAQ